MKNAITTLAALFLCLNLSAQSVTVMTYNIRNSNARDGVNAWSKRKEAFVEVIKKTNPDLLGTQEVLKDQLGFLKKVLPDYSSYGVGRNNGKSAGEHSAIFFRKEKYEKLDGGNFWMSQTPEKPGSKSWDAVITRICSWVKLKDKSSGKIVFVFNTHLDHRGVLAREESAKLIRNMIAKLAGDEAVILMGDFNFRPDSKGYELLTNDAVFFDAYDNASPNHTACGFGVANTNCSRIDYIFSTRHFKKVKYTLHTDNNGTYYPSDHLGVSAVFNF